MNSIRKIVMTCGVFAFAGVLMAQAPDASQSTAAPAAQAQTAPAKRTVDPAKQAQHLGKKLGLTQDQVSQITPIIADRQQQIASVRSDTTLQAQDRRAKMKSIFADSKTKMEAVMNDQQKRQFEQMQAAHRGHRQAQAAPQNQ